MHIDVPCSLNHIKIISWLPVIFIVHSYYNVHVCVHKYTCTVLICTCTMCVLTLYVESFVHSLTFYTCSGLSNSTSFPRLEIQPSG